MNSFTYDLPYPSPQNALLHIIKVKIYLLKELIKIGKDHKNQTSIMEDTTLINLEAYDEP